METLPAGSAVSLVAVTEAPDLQLISIDVGGTFTDVLSVDAQGVLSSYKLLQSFNK